MGPTAMINVETKQFTPSQIIATCGINPVTFRVLKCTKGLFPSAHGRGECYGIVDAGVATVIGKLMRANCGGQDAIDWAQKFIPHHFSHVAKFRLNYGLCTGASLIVNDTSAPGVEVKLDLDAIMDDVIAGLQLEEQVFAEPPSASLMQTILHRADKYVGSQSFYKRRERADKLKNPSPEELSIVLGIPLWLLNLLKSCENARKRAQAAEQLGPMAEHLMPMAEKLRGEVTLQ
jgi:hypothetical protein